MTARQSVEMEKGREREKGAIRLRFWQMTVTCEQRGGRDGPASGKATGFILIKIEHMHMKLLTVGGTSFIHFLNSWPRVPHGIFTISTAVAASLL